MITDVSSDKPERPGGPLNSFGTGGTTFDVARSQVPWTIWRSLLIAVLGASVIALAVWDGNVGLIVMSSLLTLLGIVWAAREWLSDHYARRLEARQRRRAP